MNWADSQQNIDEPRDFWGREVQYSIQFRVFLEPTLDYNPEENEDIKVFKYS